MSTDAQQAREDHDRALGYPDRYWIVVVREHGTNDLSALSRRYPAADGTPFAGPWGALDETGAQELADAWNSDERSRTSTAQAVELYRYDRDPAWPDEYA